MTTLNTAVPAELSPTQSRSQWLLTQGGASVAAHSVRLADGSEHELASLDQLYGNAVSGRSHDQQIAALCAAVEFALAFEDHHNGHALRDADVIAALEQLALKPEPARSGIAGLIQQQLQLELSLTGYDRNAVRQALRRCLREAERAHKHEGERGYLGLIHHVMH
ncbi:MAG: hypothetical protein ACO1RX_15985 [Candidatus Sericytochromatia bacterium]